VFAPLAIVFYCLVVQRGLLDGWPGWYYALQRMVAESILSLKLIERRLRSGGQPQCIAPVADRAGIEVVPHE
jgi:hypothetical protein